MSDKKTTPKISQKIKSGVFKAEKNISQAMSTKGPDIYTRFVRKTFLILVLAIALALVAILIVFSITRKGEDLAKVPSVVGLDILEAAMALEEVGLVLEVDTKFDNEIERFSVSDQYPKSGVTVREGRSVLLLVSMGQDVYTVPDVEGLNVDDVEELLREDNIPFNKTIIQSSSYVTNTVISQDLEPGTEVDRSVKMELLVNSDLKYNEFRVEDYTQKEVGYIVELLYDDDIIPVLTKSIVASADDDGFIMGQDIEAGTIVQNNSSIQLEVGVYGDDAIEKEKQNYHVFRYYLPSMSYFTNGMTQDEIDEVQEAHVVVNIEDEMGEENEIYAAYHSYGRMITVVFKSFGYTRLYLLVNNTFIKETSFDE